MKFTKLHSAGNDYICINCFDEIVEKASELALCMCDRHFGIGADGVILITDSISADFMIRGYSPDGAEAEIDANAAVLAGKYVFDYKLTEKQDLKIETLSGDIELKLFTENGIVKAARAKMEDAVLSPQLIPVDYSGEDFVDRVVEIDGVEYCITCVGTGESYAVIFTDDISDVNIMNVAPKIENFSIFPNGINVVFAEIMDKSNVRIRVWKRGFGEVLSSGGGVAAATVASVLCKKTDKSVTVQSVGGNSAVTWSDDGIYVTATAEKIADGDIEI